MADPTAIEKIFQTFHLGDMILSGVGLLMSWIGNRIYRVVKSFVDQVDGYDERIERTARVVDTHSDVLHKVGWAKGMAMPKVSQKRRREDRDLEISET